MSEPLVAAQRGESEILGHAVCRHDLLGAQQLEPGVQQRRRHHGGTLQDEDDAGQVTLPDVGPGGDARQHRGRGGEVGDPIALDDVQNQCRIELFEHHQMVAGQQEEEGGEAVGVIHRRGHHDGLRLGYWRPVRQERFALLRDPQRWRQVEDHFGHAGRTAAADSVGGGGNGFGQRAIGLAGRARIQLPAALFIDDDGGVDHRAHPVSLPFGQIPVHGNGNRADLPAPQRGQHQVLRIRNCKCDKGTRFSTVGGQGPPPLVGAGVEFTEGQRLRGAVERDNGHGRARRAVVRRAAASLVPNGIPSSSGLGPPRPRRVRCSCAPLSPVRSTSSPAVMRRSSSSLRSASSPARLMPIPAR